MRTDELIRALAADSQSRPAPLQQSIVAAAFAGAGAAAVLFAWRVRLRPDFATVIADPLFVLKFVVTLALAAAAGGLLWRLVRPGARPGGWTLALLVAPALLAAGVAYDMATQDASAWAMRLMGKNSMFCLRTIPLLAAPILIALLWGMRRGAPGAPAVAGAVAGLVAGGLGAALYASHCTDDSPLFVAVWYGVAIAIVTAVGAIAGSRLLRW